MRTISRLLARRPRTTATRALTALGVAATAVLLSGGCGESGRAPTGSRPPSTELVSTTSAQAQPLVVVPPDSPRIKQLRVDDVRARAIATDEIIAPARIVTDPNRVARVLPFVQGRVLAVLAKLGDPVAQGQPSAPVHGPDPDAAISTYLQAEATTRQASVTLAKTQADLTRARALHEDRIVSEKDMLAAENDVATAQTAADTARASREQAL